EEKCLKNCPIAEQSRSHALTKQAVDPPWRVAVSWQHREPVASAPDQATGFSYLNRFHNEAGGP
ncbi:hypothetical protein, partial [Mesorhizobium sp.]|uniref:hypothetical protein n=1 Tax=Mesorhizobium sp. TaxID=1871066 RepID=UPI0025C45E1F